MQLLPFATLSAVRILPGASLADSPSAEKVLRGWHISTLCGLVETKIIWYATPTAIHTRRSMPQKPTQKTFHLNALVNGHIIAGSVRFSPAPEPGVLTEVARFEAERLLDHLVHEEIQAGRL